MDARTERVISSQNRDLHSSRAQWQRTEGAILMRELTEGAFDQVPEFTHADLQTIWDDAKDDIYDYSHEGLSLFWAAAYRTSTAIAKVAFTGIRATAKELDGNPAYTNIRKSVFRHTYWGDTHEIMKEAETTLAHFPISLARNICQKAPYEGGIDDRFQPKTFAELADLLSSPDMQQMIDDSLVAANGFWKGFSTNINSLATTSLYSVDAYNITTDSVKYSDEAHTEFAKSLKSANQRRRYVGSVDSNGKSVGSSGCPARHLKPAWGRHNSDESLQALSEVFHKSEEDLLAPHAETVVQEGVRYIADGLRSVSVLHQQWLAQKSRVSANLTRLHVE